MGEVLTIRGAGSCGDKGGCAACPVRSLGLCAAAEVGSDLAGRISALAEKVSLEPGALLFSQGDDAAYVYALAQGTVKVARLLPDGRTHVAGFLTGGDLLGLPGMDQGTYAYEAVALTPVRLCRFRRDRLMALVGEAPALRKRLLSMVAGELASAQDQMLLLGRKTAQEKVATFLLGQRAKAARSGLPTDAVHLPMTRADIADHLGLTVETVSRCFTKLKATGAIQLLEGNRVRVRDAAGLAGLAEAA